MAEHQPGMRPQHGDVVGDVAGVGRAGADVDHGDAAIVRLDQMKGRHLRHALGRRSPVVASAEASIARDHIAGLDEGVEAGWPERHVLAAQSREGIDIELVVREDHEILEVLRIGAGVVVEPVQRIVDPRGTEQGKRFGRAGRQLQRAVGDRVVHGGEIGRVEHVAQRSLEARLFGASTAPLRY